jgi:hypothetical protein
LADDSFVLIECNSNDVASMDKEFEADLIQKGMICPSCNRIRSDADISHITVQGVINDSPVGMVTWGIGVARKEFLYCLGEEVVHRDLHVGPVDNMRGKRLDNWVMFRAKHRILVRSGPDHAGCRVCETCGNIYYFALGAPYLVKPLPRSDVGIFYSGSMDLVVRGGLTRQMREKKWRKVKFTPLEILDQPRDGLGSLAMSQ